MIWIPGVISVLIGPDIWEIQLCPLDSVVLYWGPREWLHDGDVLVLEEGSWHHFAISCWEEEHSWHIMNYLDGTSEDDGLFFDDRPLFTCGSSMAIGGLSSSVYPAMIGTVDDLRITGRALYTLDSVPFEPDRHLSVEPLTEALYHFNSETSGVIHDISSNGHDVVLVGSHLVPDDCHLP